MADLAELFSVSRATVYRVLEWARPSSDVHS
ncbi:MULTISPECIES: helix-turn-helix domain-containing protein [unclassified Streptomyces]